jgi:predicted nucleotidyltransferase
MNRKELFKKIVLILVQYKEAVQQSKIPRKRKVYNALNPKRRRKNGVKINCGTASKAIKIAIFGSYARDEAKPESDIDILVEFSERKSLLDLEGIEQELSDTLGVKADLLTEKSISPYLIDMIKREMKVIYE